MSLTGKNVIIRSTDGGCFAGTLVEQNDTVRKVVLANARRLWGWAGAASLSELAVRGTSNPQECRFPVPTKRHEIFDVVEIIEMSPEAVANIEQVSIWSE